MTPRHRTQIVRFWLAVACIAVALCWHLYMEALLIPLALFIPAFSSCTVFSDSYSTNTIADYDQRSGSWSVSSGTLGTTTASGAVIIHKTALSGVTGKASVSLGGFVTNTVYRLIGAYTDDNNHLFAEIKITGTGFGISGDMKLFDRTAAVNTQLGSTIAVSAVDVLSLCWDGVIAVAATNAISNPQPSTKTGSKAGLGADVVSGTATFDNFTLLDRSVSNCTTCNPCSNCNENSWPRQIQLDIVGTPLNGTCTACASISTTYILDFNISSPNCDYRKTFSPSGTCTLASVSASFGSGARTASLNVGLSPPVMATWTETSHSTPYDCGASVTGIPWVSGSTRCDFSPTTLSWTPIT